MARANIPPELAQLVALWLVKTGTQQPYSPHSADFAKGIPAVRFTPKQGMKDYLARNPNLRDSPRGQEVPMRRGATWNRPGIGEMYGALGQALAQIIITHVVQSPGDPMPAKMGQVKGFIELIQTGDMTARNQARQHFLKRRLKRRAGKQARRTWIHARSRTGGA